MKVKKISIFASKTLTDYNKLGNQINRFDKKKIMKQFIN